MSLRCSKVGLACILAVLPALTQPLPNLHHLVQTEVLGVPVRTSFMRGGPLRERCMCVFVCVCVCACVFIKLHIIAQSGPLILVILCDSP